VGKRGEILFAGYDSRAALGHDVDDTSDAPFGDPDLSQKLLDHASADIPVVTANQA
jgi:hypothetical protein